MIFGVNATKEAIFVAETEGTGQQFSVTDVRRIKFQIEKAGDLADLLQNISTVLDHDSRSSAVSVAILKCSGGQYGSSVEAIKAEAIAELAAVQKGLPVKEVAPQSLKKALQCATGEEVAGALKTNV
jgi:Holliday junction resolvasome RuvABC endonuclease subunit